MKHARQDYDRIQDPSGKIPEDEPVFLLRAQDTSAPRVVLEWVRVNMELGGDRNLIEAAIKQIARMHEWQREHGHKIADGDGGPAA